MPTGLVALLDDISVIAKAAAFDNLRKRGVKLQVCANTLEAYKLSLETLYNVREADLVQAAVAEFVRLQQQGYSYIKF